jgi:hypothetical protein
MQVVGACVPSGSAAPQPGGIEAITAATSTSTAATMPITVAGTIRMYCSVPAKTIA